jgi:hypothetical protein
MDFIVLVRGSDLPLKKKKLKLMVFTNFGSLNPNLHRKKFFDPGLVQKWALMWQRLDFEKFF